MKLTLDVTRLAHFWDKVKISPGNCWIWDGHQTSDKGYHSQRYGQFWNGEGKVAAHRFSYYLFYNQLPRTLFHTCDNNLCVNPHHLTPNPKMRNGRKIEYTKTRKLTPDLIQRVLRLRSQGLTQREISKRMRYAQGRIANICRIHQVINT